MRNDTRLLYGIYTLTPLHVGTGQAIGAVDLPVTREQSTGLPFIPATSIKGVVRDVLEAHLPGKNDDIKDLLGSDMKDQDDLRAGGLIFTEAQILALPFRSLNMPFVFVTSYLVLERFDRNLRAFGFADTLTLGSHLKNLDRNKPYVSDKAKSNELLVIEDLIFNKEEVLFHEAVTHIASSLQDLLPEDEQPTRDRLQTSLVILPDREYLALARRCLPVQARTKLTSGKTASKYTSPEGKEEKGNLWYEETVPSDSLFAFFVMNRSGASSKPKAPVDRFNEVITTNKISLSPVQMGGNETVGHGWCWWQNLLSKGNIKQ
ncbi:MAG: type III-B CRISPR module RAMP protein Cmr4 [Thermodesulfobacteriota bacterium]